MGILVIIHLLSSILVMLKIQNELHTHPVFIEIQSN